MLVRPPVHLTAVFILTLGVHAGGLVQERLLQAEERARDALHKLLTETRTTLNDSLTFVHDSRFSITDVATESAMDAAASLSALLDTVRQAVHTAVDSVPDRGAALRCVDGAETLAEDAVAAAVRGIGTCASNAAGTDQNLTQHLADLVQDAERRALEAVTGMGVENCVVLPRLKDALNCLAEQVRATRTDVQNRVGTGVREARALEGRAARTVQDAGSCIATAVQLARQQVDNVTAGISRCVDALN